MTCEISRNYYLPLALVLFLSILLLGKQGCCITIKDIEENEVEGCDVRDKIEFSQYKKKKRKERDKIECNLV